MKILVPGDVADFRAVSELLATRGEMTAVRSGAPTDDALALAWARDAEDTAEITRLAKDGWRVFAVSRGELRVVRAVLLQMGAEDVCADPPTLEWIEACAETVKRSRNRREVRHVANVSWSLARAKGAAIKGKLVNVSRGGFKLRLIDPPAVGEVLLANFAPETGVPPLYSRVLSVEMGKQNGWWVRARFVALRKDEAGKLEGWLETLEREDVDPEKALVAIEAMNLSDLRSESNAIGGVRLPPFSRLERSWVQAAEGTHERDLARIPLARARAQTVATVLASAPTLPFDPPIERWKAEIAGARNLAHDPAALAAAVGDVTSDPVGAREFTAASEALDRAAEAFDRTTANFLLAARHRSRGRQSGPES